MSKKWRYRAWAKANNGKTHGVEEEFLAGDKRAVPVAWARAAQALEVTDGTIEMEFIQEVEVESE